jgi:hypothetical protein
MPLILILAIFAIFISHVWGRRGMAGHLTFSRSYGTFVGAICEALLLLAKFVDFHLFVALRAAT